MTSSELMLFTIRSHKNRLRAKRLTNLYVVYHEVFRRINYDDEFIKNIYLKIVNDQHILMIFYIDKLFNLKEAEECLLDFKLNVERINFDYHFVPYKEGIILQSDDFLKIK